MPKIGHFRVTGLAGRDLTIEHALNADVNIIFGRNGGGKTTLLKVLDSALCNDASRLANVAVQDAEVTIVDEVDDEIYVRRLGWEGAKQSLSLLGNTSEDNLRAKRVWHTTPPTPDGMQETWSSVFLPTSRLYLREEPSTISFSLWRGVDTKSSPDAELDRAFASSIQKLWQGYSNRTLSFVSRTQSAGLARILDTVLLSEKASPPEERLDPHVSFERMRKFVRRQGSGARLRLTEEQFAMRLADDEKLRRVVQHIDKVERRIERATRPRIDLQAVIGRLYGDSKQLEFSDSEIGIRLPNGSALGLEALSSGEKHLLRLLLEALSVEAHSVLMIDEPEISLHIDWQRTLVRVLRQLNPSSQLIVASHAPEIMAEVDESKIFEI